MSGSRQKGNKKGMRASPVEWASLSPGDTFCFAACIKDMGGRALHCTARLHTSNMPVPAPWAGQHSLLP